MSIRPSTSYLLRPLPSSAIYSRTVSRFPWPSNTTLHATSHPHSSILQSSSPVVSNPRNLRPRSSPQCSPSPPRSDELQSSTSRQSSSCISYGVENSYILPGLLTPHLLCAHEDDIPRGRKCWIAMERAILQEFSTTALEKCIYQMERTDHVMYHDGR